ncbi:DUF4230 domain-containing protein [Streptomyces sp. MB22_4]|uniref:DUF4230 domain-containing protein n=1 Tax=Streptomyces sp. MB22_4 TaxID=3383120 RepID=UPI0039A36E40
MTTPLGRPPRRMPGWAKALTTSAMVPAPLFAGTGPAVLPGVGDLLGARTHDHSGPALLKSVGDMSRYDAASGDVQVVVDLGKDAAYLPEAVRGTRTPYAGAGTVDAYADLGEVDGEDVTVDEDRATATPRLPRARLGEPALDADHSRAVSKQRGLLDRLDDPLADDPGSEHAVQKPAVSHIGEAARGGGPTARAEADTTDMLEGLPRSLGFQEVHVSYGS